MDKGYVFRELTNTKSNRNDDLSTLSGIKPNPMYIESKSDFKHSLISKRLDKSNIKPDGGRKEVPKESAGTAYNPRGCDVVGCNTDVRDRRPIHRVLYESE